jgi:hypothetical protein
MYSGGVTPVFTLHFSRRKLAKLLVCTLAFVVVFAATQARFSQYRPVVAPTGAMAKSVKLAECRFQKVFSELSVQVMSEDAIALELLHFAVFPELNPTLPYMRLALTDAARPLRI